MAPGMSNDEIEREKKKTPGLHVKQGAKRADAPRDKPRQKIRTAPGQSRGQAEQNSHKSLSSFAALHGEAELGHHFLQILPDFAFCGGITEQVRRVVCGH